MCRQLNFEDGLFSEFSHSSDVVHAFALLIALALLANHRGSPSPMLAAATSSCFFASIFAISGAFLLQTHWHRVSVVRLCSSPHVTRCIKIVVTAFKNCSLQRNQLGRAFSSKAFHIQYFLE
jgi:hypothetical protein